MAALKREGGKRRGGGETKKHQRRLQKLGGEDDSFFVETLKSLAECPICMEIPRSGKFYLCQNSHSICEDCYNKLDSNTVEVDPNFPYAAQFASEKKCPECRVTFPLTPMKNRTLEKLIDQLDHLDFPCRYEAYGCAVIDRQADLRHHERDCPHRPVECPRCNKEVALNKIRNHVGKDHQDIPPCVPVKKLSSSKITVCIESWLFGTGAMTRRGLSIILSSLDLHGRTFCPSIVKQNQLWYIWIYLVGANKSDLDRFEANLNIDENKVNISGPCPIVSVVKKVDEVIQEQDGLIELSNKLMASLMDKKSLSNEERKAGYVGRFNVKFVIVDKNAPEVREGNNKRPKPITVTRKKVSK